jgi:hypothetical protein
VGKTTFFLKVSFKTVSNGYFLDAIVQSQSCLFSRLNISQPSNPLERADQEHDITVKRRWIFAIFSRHFYPHENKLFL